MTNMHKQFKPLFSSIENDLTSLDEKQSVSQAEELAKATGIEFNTRSVPSYFTGNLTAKTVFVMLNPGYEENEKRDESPKDEDVRMKFEKEISKLPIKDRLRKYLDHARDFGTTDRDRLDNFDTKQAAFLYPFNIAELRLPEEKFWKIDASGKLILDKDLQLEAKESVIMNKLQLELFPYGSRKFDTGKVRKCGDVLSKYVGLLLETITAAPRELVVFGGVVFKPLFEAYNKTATGNGTFEIGDEVEIGGIMQKNCYCHTVRINYKGVQITGLIARSFPVQSFPNAPHRMYAYGEKCHEILERHL